MFAGGVGAEAAAAYQDLSTACWSHSEESPAGYGTSGQLAAVAVTLVNDGRRRKPGGAVTSMFMILLPCFREVNKCF